MKYIFPLNKLPYDKQRLSGGKASSLAGIIQNTHIRPQPAASEGFRFCLYKDGEEEEVAEIALSAPDDEAHVEVKQPDEDKKGQA